MCPDVLGKGLRYKVGDWQVGTFVNISRKDKIFDKNVQSKKIIERDAEIDRQVIVIRVYVTG